MVNSDVGILKRILGFFLFIFSTILVSFSTTIIFLVAYLFAIAHPIFPTFCHSRLLFFKKCLGYTGSIGSMKRVVYHTDQYNPKNPKATLVLINHQHNLDVPIIMKFPFRSYFLSKAQMFKIPILATCIKVLGEISIDRSNKRNALQSITKIIESLKNERNIIIFPEGKRNKNPDIMLPFQEGFGLIAKKAKSPILPIIIYGTNLVYGNNQELFYNWPQVIHVKFLKPITLDHKLHPANSESEIPSKEKIQEIREIMQNAYQQLKKSIE